MIDITLLGTSALVPLPDRAETAALLVCGGHSVLFDCGEGTQTAARRAGVSLMKTDIIALTHYHGDHIFGLPGLMQTMSILGRTDPLTILGPGEVQRELAPILTLAGALAFPVQIFSLPEEGIALNRLHPGWPDGAYLSAFPTMHRVVSQGYVFALHRSGKFLPDKARALEIPEILWSRLQRGETVTHNGCTVLPEQVLGPERKGLKVVFSGDTIACPSLVQASQNADLLLCEATYGENEQAALAASHGHMNFAQAGTVAAEANAKRLWLMHYSQMVEAPEDYLPNAQAAFPTAVCGVDGMQVTLRFEE